ncbi:MAG TPA: tetratricopeptide repeat protein [Flavisolibacter sp.]|nr:tetratricopeptide repeat protein [Flavisolibacter sp.]
MQPTKQLSVKSELKRKLTAGENHTYSIDLKKDDFFHLKVIQNGIDIVARVSSANKEFSAQFDSPTGEMDAENIYLMSDSSQTYELNIHPVQKYADPGYYSINIVRHEKASEKDRKWMAALKATQEADKLRTKAETRERSIEQYKLAAAQWQAVGDVAQYANTVRSLGFVQIREKQYEEAVQTFTGLLPVWRKLNDTRAEGFTHLIIGRIYNLQNDYKASLNYNLSSLDFWRKTNDYDQETFTLMNIGNLYTRLWDKEKAVDYFEQALKKNQLSRRPSVKAVVLRDYANAMLLTGENEKAVALFEASIKEWQKTANTPEEARTAVQLADFFSKMSNKQNASHYYKHAYVIWEKLADEKEMKTVQELMDKLEVQKVF